MNNEYTALLLIEHLNAVKEAVKHLENDIKSTEEQLINLMEHTNEGSKTYAVGQYKVTVTTGYNLKLDQQAYKDYLSNSNKRIDGKFNVVSEVTDYKINKKDLTALQQYGSPDDKMLLSQFVTSTDKKPSVSIKFAGDK